MNRIITLLACGMVMFLSLHAAAQTKTVTGTVFAKNDGLPLQGVTIQVDKQTNKGIVSDAEGRFSIAVPDGAVLTFSAVGYITQQIQADAVKDNLQV